MSGQPADALTMDVVEAAALLRVGADWLTRQARAGLVPHVRMGRTRRFTAAHLDVILAQREQPARDPMARTPRQSAARTRRSA